MTTLVNFKIAKLLKEKGFDNECEDFYSKYGSLNSLKPDGDYKHLHSYSEQLVSYFDGKYNWNSLDVDEGMIALKTAFSESDGYVNCECSAPTITEVVMWLYEKHGIWISVDWTPQNNGDEYPFKVFWYYFVSEKIGNPKNTIDNVDETEFNSPTEAYEAAIEYCLTKLI